MNPLALPVRRPVATAMFFAALILLGLLAWQRIPVELFPPVSGDQLFINFVRPGSEPEVLEREILIPLEGRVGELGGVEESWGTASASSGSLRLRFRRGTDMKVRELELRRLSAELAHGQPPGTLIDVGAPTDFSAMSRFVMVVQITAPTDRHALRAFVEDRLEPRLAAVPGVSRILLFGGSPAGVNIYVDPHRLAAFGLRPRAVTGMLARVVDRSRYVGGIEDDAGRSSVMIDGRPAGLVSLADAVLDPGGEVRLRHVARVEEGAGREENIFRVNGRQAVGVLVFKKEDANLVRLGQALRARFDELGEEFGEQGIGFSVNFDAADLVEQQMRRLQKLALSGFLIALIALMLFLRQLRAVMVVAVAVPTSLLIALALLFLFDQSLNLITLFGLAVGLGMLVDNAIVVYEAVQRQLEHGQRPDAAAEAGVRRTVRAILAASVTNAVVFFPLLLVNFGDSSTQALLSILAVAYLLPLGGSLLVALGLVPLLARYLGAPAALRRIEEGRRARALRGWLSPPDVGRELFGGVLKTALRRPGVWLAAVLAAVLITAAVGLGWFASGGNSAEAQRADEVRLAVKLPGSSTLEKTSLSMEQLEKALSDMPGVEQVSSFIQEGSGSLTVKLVEEEKRPPDATAARVRELARRVAERELPGVEILRPGEGERGGASQDEETAGLLGQGPARVRLSGPDAAKLTELGKDLVSRLEALEEVGNAWIPGPEKQKELVVLPRQEMLASMGLTADEILPALAVLRREGVVMRTGMVLRNGREIPLTVYREGSVDSRRALALLPIETPAGAAPLGTLSRIREMPGRPAIRHHDGRRELSVLYRLAPGVPDIGPRRDAIEEQIRSTIQGLHRPEGYTVETEAKDASTSWFRKILIPVVLLLLAVLAVTFESFTLPLLVLAALPLTLIGACWALVFAGMPADPMALVGALALLGLTVNPAILLVDVMQEKSRSRAWGPGAAALAAVRARTRPVLMTTITTVAGLWPLALATGRENEIWPPFATVVMGGLVASTVLTLLVIPLGYVILKRLDLLFGRLGVWVVLAWIGATALCLGPMIWFGWLTSLTWQIITGALLAAGWLLAIAGLWRRDPPPPPSCEEGRPPAIDVRTLGKIYSSPGPVRSALRVRGEYARRVLERGGTPFLPEDARQRLMLLTLLGLGSAYLASFVQSGLWRIVFLFLLAALVGGSFRQLRVLRGKVDPAGVSLPGGVEGAISFAAPWVAWEIVAVWMVFAPWLRGEVRGSLVWRLVGLALLATIIALLQLGRHTAARIGRGELSEVCRSGRLRTFWRRSARRVLAPAADTREVRALDGVEFKIDRGMVGILGPNGAGKTTLLRLVAGILEPTVGRIHLGGVPLGLHRTRLARWMGYLPQDFGLPKDMSAREYLEYFALLYEIAPRRERRERVERLLGEVGLAERGDERISSYSGGMRQRVAIARTLLRLPPVIIVDEPTVGLDPRERIRFRNLLSRLARGRIVLFSTHVVEDVAVSCERVMVISEGRLVYDGSPEKLAAEAEGKVWRVRLAPDEAARLGDDVRIVDQVPEPDGRLRLRVLCERPIGAGEEPLEPSLEDGYMTLLATAARAAS